MGYARVELRHNEARNEERTGVTFSLLCAAHDDE
jgi:hypothetical protein